MRHLLTALVLITAIGCASTARPPAPDRTAASEQPAVPDRPPNVLFIAVDDLRPEFGAYGQDHIHAPALDRLAEGGVVFQRAYVNVPVCGANRAALLTGLRPTRTRFLGYDVRVDEEAPGVPTLPQHFRTHGYRTVGLGKIYHHADDAPQSWDEPLWHPNEDPATKNATWRDYLLPGNQARDVGGRNRGAPYEAAPVEDEAYYDGKTAARAVEELQALAQTDEPFFLAVGFLKPHLPFNAPQRYWDLYTEADLQQAPTDTIPPTAPHRAWHSFGELRAYAFVPPRPAPVSDTLALKLVHGYYAAVSYIDAQIGRVLDELDRLGLADDTIVVLWGDHGFSLGEHGLWCKHSPFHVATHQPLIIRAPSATHSAATDGLAETIDVYPTLVDLAGLPMPEHLAGESLAPLLRDPAADVQDAVFPRYYAAESVQTDRYTYTEWVDDEGHVEARMLYDRDADPDELLNVAEDPTYASVVADLSERLHAHVRSLGHAAP